MFKADAILSDIECTTPAIVPTATGTYTLTAGSMSQQIFTGSAEGQVVKLPDARELQLGWTYIFWNKSTKLITIVDNGNNVLTTCITNARTRFTLENNVTANGAWAAEPPIYARLLNSASTGILMGGIITVNADPTKFDISDGNGVVLNNYTDTNNPIITHVAWTGKTAIVVTNLATADVTYIGIDAAGSIIQQTTEFTNVDRRDIIALGYIGHPSGISITYTVTEPDISYDTPAVLYSFMDTVGIVNRDGNVFMANGANLKIDKGAGRMFKAGLNYSVSHKNPNTKIIDLLTALSFFYIYRDPAVSGGWAAQYPLRDTVIPGKYDDGSGTLQNVTSGYYTIQTVFFYPESASTFIQYGQRQYVDVGTATADINREIEVSPIVTESCFRCWMIVKQNATDLSDITQAVFVAAGKFGMVSPSMDGGGGGGGEANTASNVGTAGVGFFKQKLGVDLQFKNLRSICPHISVTDNPDDNTVVLELVGEKSGVVAAGSFSLNPKKATVTFVTPFADATYSIVISGADTRIWSYESKGAGSFVINSNANQALTGEVSWRATVSEND